MTEFIVMLILAHSFYAKECCADKDCHPIPCDEIVDMGNGWKWQDRYFTKDMLRISPDGECHVCVSAAPICIYLPAKT